MAESVCCMCFLFVVVVVVFFLFFLDVCLSCFDRKKKNMFQSRIQNTRIKDFVFIQTLSQKRNKLLSLLLLLYFHLKQNTNFI